MKVANYLRIQLVQILHKLYQSDFVQLEFSDGKHLILYPEYKSYNDAVSLSIYSAIDDVDFVKFIAREQNSRQRNFSLSELMILRYLTDNRRISLAIATNLIQGTRDMAQKSLNALIREGLIEVSGKEYMLTAKMYKAVKSDIEYAQDKVLQYVKAKGRIMEYVQETGSITNAQVRELCGFTRQQARITLEKMQTEEIIVLQGKGRYAKYVAGEKIL